jgi:glycosyltransferase involved in cell wall biosynthesis
VKRILIVIKSDGIGGVERRVSGLLDAFERRAMRCDLVALSASSVTDGLLVSREVHVLASRIPLSPLRRIHQLIQLRSLLNRNDYDAVLAFGPSPNALASLARGRRTLTVISENGNPFVSHRRLWNATMMRTYRRADALLVLTQRLADDLQARGTIPRTVSVAHPMLSTAVPLVPPSVPRSPTIVTVGRLVPSKRVGDLVSAFASIADRFSAWSLTIVGDGRERRALQGDVAARGLDNRVTFTGFVQEPWHQVATASIFVLCSAYEGFGNVLIEAVASGCALISSDCRYGPREILRDGELGLLYPVGDVARLRDCLVRLMDDPTGRRNFAERAFASVGQYRADPSEDPWIERLTSLAEGRRD